MRTALCPKILFFVFLFMSGFALAIPKTTTFQMKIMKPDGTPLEAASVNFQFTTMSPTGTCVLYVEQFAGISLAGSNGLVVLNLGTGTQAFTGVGSSYMDVFNNVSTSINCQGSGSYVPTAVDRRRIIVQFNDGSAAGWQSLPAVDINSVPYSNYADDSEKFSGKIVTDFTLKAAFPDCNASGKVLTYNGTTFSCVSPSAGSGTVSSVTSANSYLSIATNTTTPVITANVGTAANTLAAGNDTRITGAAQKANNLSDLASAATARTNLGSTATGDALFTAASATAARTTLGLGTAAILDAGTSANNLVQLDAGAKIPAALLPNHDASLITTGTIAAARLPASATFWQDAGSGKINYNGGNVGIGTATPFGLLHADGNDINSQIFVSNTDSTSAHNPGFVVYNFDGAGLGGYPKLSMRNSRGAFGAQVATQAGDIIAALEFQANRAGTWTTPATIQAIATETQTNAARGGAISFMTTKNGTNVLSEKVRIDSNGNVGFGFSSPTANIHLKAGTATAGTAPLKLAAGTNLTAPESGAIEFDGTNLFYTDSTPTRRTIATTGGTGNSYTGVSSIANSAGNISLDPNSTTGSVLVSSSTASVGAASGALVVSGGVGVGGAINSTGSISSGASISATTSMFTPQLYGSAAASGNIKVDGTSNAAKGFVLLNSAGGNVGVGTVNPAETLHIAGTTKVTSVLPANKTALYMNHGQAAGASATSIAVYPYINGSDVITNVTGMVVDSPTTTTGSYGNYYGIQILGSTAATTSMRGLSLSIPAGASNWNIYGSSTAQNYLAGNLGIGIPAPAARLAIAGGGTGGSDTFTLTDSASNSTFRVTDNGNQYYGGGGINTLAMYPNTQVNSSPRTLRWSNLTAATNEGFQFYNSNLSTSLMMIQQNGYVGIGTAAPSGILDVNGGTAAAATNGTNVSLTAQTAGAGNQNGGSIVLTPGAKSGTGVPGAVVVGVTSPPSWINANSIYVTGMNYANLGYQTLNNASLTFGTSSTSVTGSGSSNSTDYISFRTNATTRFYMDGSGYVGIGTSTPAYKLDVAGLIRSSTGGFQFPDGTVMTTAGVGTSTGATSTTDLNFAADTDANTSGEMMFATAGTERMRIANAGAIGIGVTTPSSTSKLNIQDVTGKTPLQLTTSSAASTDSLYLSVNGRAKFGYDGTRAAVVITDRDVAGTTTSKPIVFDSNATERMRIDTAGYVGIGVTAPLARLDVSNDTGVVSGFQQVAKFYRTGGNFGGISLGYWADGVSDTASAIRTTGNTSDLILAPNTGNTATERLRIIATTGNVGIGIAAPTSKLHVAGGAITVDNDQSFVMTDTTGLLKGSLKMSAANNLQISNNSTTGHMQLSVLNDIGAFGFYTGSTPTAKMTLLNNGNLGIGTGAPAQKLDVVGDIQTSGCLYYASSSLGTCASDERIKTDVRGYDLGLEALLGINPVRFKYNGLAGFKTDGKEQLGVIAQQVEKVAPSLVKTKMVQLHEGDQQQTEIKVVDYGAFTYVIINAIKDLYAKWSDDSKDIRREIASVKADNAEKDKQIAELKQRLDQIEKALNASKK